LRRAQYHFVSCVFYPNWQARSSKANLLSIVVYPQFESTGNQNDL